MDLLADIFQSPETRWIPAFAAAAAVGAIAFRVRALTASGIVAATIVGGSIVAAAGWWHGVVLVTFFVTASALSLVSLRNSEGVQQARGKRRDAVQVLANGGIPAALAVASALADRPEPWLAAAIAAIAGAASDTWATEIGRFSHSRPRLVTTWKPVMPGTSGAVSLAGTAGSLAGALVIGLAAAAGQALGWTLPGVTAGSLIVTIAVAGFGGSLVDSLLGATAQAGYRCPACGIATEQPVHTCGARTVHEQGVAWLNNDTVNALAIAAAAMAGFFATIAWQS